MGTDRELFIERLYDSWFIRWRLKLQDYNRRVKFLNEAIRLKEQVSPWFSTTFPSPRLTIFSGS